MAESMYGHSPAWIFGYSHVMGGYAGGQAHVHRYMKSLYEMTENGQVDPSFVVTHVIPLEETRRMLMDI